jgi:hypothetical protein
MCNWDGKEEGRTSQIELRFEMHSLRVKTLSHVSLTCYYSGSVAVTMLRDDGNAREDRENRYTQ